MTNYDNMIDWDYWPYIWLVWNQEDEVIAIKDFNGWFYYLNQETLGL
jgi:hypothetical protein